jgi:hypothetical protein
MDTKQNATHEEDFYGWTQEQAAILRGMSANETRLDVANLAEEIEDMGRTEIREITSLLKRTVAHLLKLTIEPGSQAASHWFDEVATFQSDAVAVFSPGLKQRIDFEKIWRLASNEATRSLENHGTTVPGLPDSCPLTLDELLVEDFDPKTAIETISAAINPSSKHSV